jgi:hypothetical protein
MSKTLGYSIVSSNWNTDNISFGPDKASNSDSKDPNPAIIPNSNISGSFLEQKKSTSTSEQKDSGQIYKIFRINGREPYASETVVTKYGSLESKLGTNLGR